jgi:hypothetical protein
MLNKFLKKYKIEDSKTLFSTNNNYKLFQYLCYKNRYTIRNIEIPEIIFNSECEALFIEFRKLPHVEFLIRNAILKLGNNWSHTVICGNQNFDYMKKMCLTISPNIKIIKLNYDNITPSEYSKILTTLDFWNQLIGEKILIYQEDSIIFNSNINDFIHWDYIGAPFLKLNNDTPNSVGNGGLSLRSKSIMIKVIETISVDQTIFEDDTLTYMTNNKCYFPPEDIYFSKNMQDLNIGKVADWDSAYHFSSESIYNPNSFGGHKIWISNPNWKEIMNNFFKYSTYVPNSDINKYLKYINFNALVSNKRISNAFDIDLYFCNKVNKLELSNEQEILKYIKNTGLKGFIYHPKQIMNIYPTIQIFYIMNDIYIKYQQKLFNASNFVSKYIYNVDFTYLSSLLIKKKYANLNKNISLLLLVFIGNEERGIDLIYRIIKYKQFQRINVSFCFNSKIIMTKCKYIIKQNFVNYAIYLSNEFGTDITPTLLMYNDICKYYECKYIIKLHSKSILNQYEDLTTYILSIPLKSLLLQKQHNSNCIGHTNYYTILDNDIYNKQLLFNHFNSINISNTFIAGTIFCCENITMQKVCEFVKNNNFKCYLFNNLYENNSINKNYSPIHFLERLFGIIIIDKEENLLIN